MAKEVLRSLREGEFRVKKDRVFITQKGELVIIGAVMIKHKNLLKDEFDSLTIFSQHMEGVNQNESENKLDDHSGYQFSSSKLFTVCKLK